MNPTTRIVGPIRDKGAEPLPLPATALDRVREYIRASKAENTLRGCRSEWRDFSSWCEERGLCPLPASPETVAAYIAGCAGYLKVGSKIGRASCRERV